MDLLKALDDLGRPQLLRLRRRIEERLYEIKEDEYAATVAAYGFKAPPGWGANDGQTDGTISGSEQGEHA